MGLSLAARGAIAVILLCFSNAAMTTAWYLHLKFKSWPMYQAILISWAIAFTEYCLQVPANRIGYAGEGGPFTAPQLKVIQEFISLTAFAIFSTWVLKDKLRWADFGAFMLIFAGVLLSLLTKAPSTDPTTVEATQQPAHRRLLHLAAWHLSQPAEINFKQLGFSRSQQALPPQLERVSAQQHQQPAVGEEKQLVLMPSGELIKDGSHSAALQLQQQQQLRRRPANQQQEAGHSDVAIQLATAGERAIGRTSTDAPLLEVAREAVTEDDSPKDSLKAGSSTRSGLSVGSHGGERSHSVVAAAAGRDAMGDGGTPAMAVPGNVAAAGEDILGPAGGGEPARQQR